MAVWLKYALVAVIGYLMGNISMGLLIGRLWGVRDIRSCGSGNAGSTNVLRTLGWAPSLLTLAGDCAKAFVAAKLGGAVAGEIGLLIGGLAAVVGHDFPVFLRFRGGKGVASSLGFVLAMHPLGALVMLCIEIVLIAITHMVSVASMANAIIYPLLIAYLTLGSAYQTEYIITGIILAALLIFCHRSNLVRLIHHNENKLDFGKISSLSKRNKNKGR